MASVVCPCCSVSTGCCEPAGNWFRIEFTLALISVNAESGSWFRIMLMVMVLVLVWLVDVM